MWFKLLTEFTFGRYTQLVAFHFHQNGTTIFMTLSFCTSHQIFLTNEKPPRIRCSCLIVSMFLLYLLNGAALDVIQPRSRPLSDFWDVWEHSRIAIRGPSNTWWQVMALCLIYSLNIFGLYCCRMQLNISGYPRILPWCLSWYCRGLRCSWEGLALLDSILPTMLLELEKFLQSRGMIKTRYDN